MELGPTQTFGIYNKEGSPVASFDSVGNATVSGTLYADRIITRFGDLDARLARLEEATQSSVIPDPVGDPSLDSRLRGNDTGDNVLDATSSALLALLSQDVAKLKSDSFDYAQDKQSDQLIDGTILIDKTGISTITDTLYIQPARLGNLDLMGGTIVVNTAGDVVINGNLAITGNLSIGGILGINVIRPTNGFADLVFDATGAARFTGDVIASGSGVFRDIAVSASASGTLLVGAGESVATVSGAFTPDERTSFTSGVMISVVPTWETVVWVASRSADRFTINFSTPPLSTASADWLIVRRQ